ncbi:TetR/AcrR family transcriptional regulator [Acidocella sp.]|uniref:TetR/AcrR family transcriptional regulator n=1 Tax=Acidocella sp. TaxID=50710 RepID=UPI0026044881|nr:TetR/AcrR family transcriptional regulator [Acidocella sp.]
MDTPPGPTPFRNAGEREQERAAKRDAVLRAAVRMFNERGFHTTSLDDVAASLQISKPLIYHYLGAKDQVLFECLRLGLTRLREAAEAAAAQPGTGLERLKYFLRRYGEVIMDDFGRCVVRTDDEALSTASRAKVRAMKREIDQGLRRLMEEAVADGSACIGDIKLTTFAFTGALSWTMRWHKPEGGMPPGEIAGRLVDILIRGIEPRG